MIDAARWVIAEAWLSLGLRLAWASSWQESAESLWQPDDEEGTRYRYDGSGLWLVRAHDRDRTSFGYTRPTSPQMGTTTMKHELAHYFAASVEQRQQVNFGLATDDNEAEERTLQAEQVIDALLTACARIAGLALTRQA